MEGSTVLPALESASQRVKPDSEEATSYKAIKQRSAGWQCRASANAKKGAAMITGVVFVLIGRRNWMGLLCFQMNFRIKALGRTMESQRRLEG